MSAPDPCCATWANTATRHHTTCPKITELNAKPFKPLPTPWLGNGPKGTRT